MQWLLPNLLPPVSRQEREAHVALDQAENDRTTPSHEEQVSCRVVWGVEVYGPNEVEALVEQLDQLGWQAGFGEEPERKASAWVMRERAHGIGQSYYNVGFVVEHSKASFQNRNTATLPAGVSHLLVALHQPTPSLTCVIVAFVLEPNLATVYDMVLRKRRKTRFSRGSKRGTILFWGPALQKERDVRANRSGLQVMVRRWFKQHLPGYFCQSLVRRLPTTELIFTQKDHAIAKPAERQRPDWQHAFDSAPSMSVWSHTEVAGLRYCFQGTAHDVEAYHGRLSVRLPDFPAERIEHYGAGDERAIPLVCHEMVSPLLCMHGVLVYLMDVSRELRTCRTSLRFSSSSRRQGLDALTRVQKHMDSTLGAPTVLAELTQAPGWSRWAMRDASFLSAPYFDDQAPTQLATTLETRIVSQAKSLALEEQAIREHFTQLASLLSIRESVRAQTATIWLSIVAVVIAALSLVAAIPEARSWVETVIAQVVAKLN